MSSAGCRATRPMLRVVFKGQGALLLLALLCIRASAYMLPAPWVPELAALAEPPKPKNPSSIDYYKVLGIKPSATPEMIKRAYRERAKVTHPDLRLDRNYDEFVRVKEAYQVLSNQELKTAYDRKRAMGLGFRFAEIVAVEVIIPVARDVAMPLVQEAMEGIGKTVVTPLVNEAVKKGHEIADPIMEKVAEPIRETVAFLDERKRQVTDPIFESMERTTVVFEKSAAFIDEKKRQVTEPFTRTAAMIDKKKRESEAFIEEKKRQVTAPIFSTVEKSAAFLEETKRQVSEPFIATAAFIDDTKRQVTDPVIATMERSKTFVGDVLHKAEEFKQLEATKRAEQIRMAEKLMADFIQPLSQLLAIILPFRLAATSSAQDQGAPDLANKNPTPQARGGATNPTAARQSDGKAP